LKPVGLTRAEEALDQQGPQTKRVAAPLGAIRCGMNVQAGCAAAATVTVVWKDGARTPSCVDCTLQARQQLPGAIIRIER